MEQTIKHMVVPTPDPSTMYQDFTARRPMEIETYLGNPVQLAKSAKIKVPRLETLYTLLRHTNITNKDRPAGPSPTTSQAPRVAANNNPPPRQSSMGMNGGPRPMRGSGMGPNMGPPGRRGPPPVNGFRGPPSSYPQRGTGPLQREGSFEENGLEEFSHVVLYDDLPDGDFAANYTDGSYPNGPSMRERELMLREKELQLKQQEMAMRGRGGRRPSHNRHQDYIDDDDDDDEDYFDPMQARNPAGPRIDPDNVDMMSITSRRNKRTMSSGQMRNGNFGGMPGKRPGPFSRFTNRQRTSTQLMNDMPMVGENILDNAMIGFSSNRYGTVDRKEMANESRTNSLTAARLQDMNGLGGPYPGPPSRRTSRSPGNPFNPGGRPSNRPSPPNDPYMQSGPPRNGRPSPPGGMQAPVARYPPGHGNSVHPHQVEQQAGVSKPFPPKPPTKSLTGSASASAGSGDSSSANLGSEPSAHSSTSSFAQRPMLALR